MRLFSLAAFGLVTAFAAAESTARADDTEVQARLSFIEGRLEAGTGAANRWSYGWLAGFGGLSLTEAGVALGTPSKTLRTDAATGAVAASFGVVPFGLFAFTPRFAAAELASFPSGTPAERKHKLAIAEALLKQSAEVEERGRGWVTHVLGNGVAIGWAVVIAAGYHRISTGILTGIGGTALVEIQIWTQPTAAIRDWKVYTNWDSRHPARASVPSVSIVPTLGGGSVVGSF